MIISILTLFPDLFSPVLSHSIIGRAQKKGLVEIRTINIRDFAIDEYGTVDDKPYGGGVGMVMRVDVVERAITHCKNTTKQHPAFKERTVLLDPTGEQFQQSKAQEYTGIDHLLLICGHYEGIDARIHHFIDERLSIGSYILTGGEIPALVVTDCVVRLIEGVLPVGATTYESHSDLYLHEPPHYTRPPLYKGYAVPDILLSGDRAKIEKWKQAHAISQKKPSGSD